MAADVEDREAVRDLIQASAWLLDNEDSWDQWVELFAEDATYEVTAYSTEIRTEMQWFSLNGREEMKSWMEEIPIHVRDVAQRFHIVSPIRIDVQGDNASSLSSFVLYRTTPDGVTHFYAIGRYNDTMVKRNGRWQIAKRTVLLDTRVLDVGTHTPF